MYNVKHYPLYVQADKLFQFLLNFVQFVPAILRHTL